MEIEIPGDEQQEHEFDLSKSDFSGKRKAGEGERAIGGPVGPTPPAGVAKSQPCHQVVRWPRGSPWWLSCTSSRLHEKYDFSYKKFNFLKLHFVIFWYFALLNSILKNYFLTTNSTKHCKPRNITVGITRMREIKLFSLFMHLKCTC